MLTICAMTGGATYAAVHLSANDYYSENEKVLGHWMGHGAELLGLQGEVQMDQFDAIRQGFHPATGEFLRQRQSADRYSEQGEKLGTARNLYDFTISAPKSISIQSLADPRLVKAHNEAVTEAVQELDRLAAARVRKNGAQENRITGNLVIAAYRHDTSRELDPQIHTHLVAGNLTYDGVEGRWKALQASEIYEQRAYLTEVYRNTLAAKVNDLGYRTVDRFDGPRERGFEIEGVGLETIEKFSQRSAQRDRAIAAFTEENGRAPTNDEVAVLVRETRGAKMAISSNAEVRERQWARMSPEEAAMLPQLRREAQERGSVRQQVSAGDSLAYAREHVFERVSVAKDFELKAEALRHSRGAVDLGELKTAVLLEASRGAFLQVGNDVATRESLARERSMIETIDRGIGAYPRLGRTQEFVAADWLRPEQKLAIETVLDSRDLAIDLRGAAGVGKTAVLQEMKRGLTEARRGVVAVAPTRSAVEELEKVGFGSAMTIARLLQDPHEQAQLTGQVLIVDEAGMISSKDMADILALSKRAGAQIVFSGDTAQIKSVEEGDALRVLERESKLRVVSLSQVQRQTLAAYREAVEDLRRDPSLGFSKFEEMGAIREVEWKLRPQEVSRAYREALKQPNAKGQVRDVLVVASTHEEIRNVTHAIRRDLQQAGELGQGQNVVRHEPLNWTEAQKRQPKSYRPGLILEFHKATKGVKKNEALEVVSADKNGITTRNSNGKEVRLSQRQVKAFGVFERHEFEVAPGDRLLLQANRREKGFRATNGQLVTVAEVESGSIRLTDGRTLPANYRQINHGYAVTAHRGQGKSVDAVVISGDRMAQDLFYVATTRGRESLTIITSDKEQLRETIGISGERQSATELERRLSPAPSVSEELTRLQHAYQATYEAPSISVRQHQQSQEVKSHEYSSNIGISI